MEHSRNIYLQNQEENYSAISDQFEIPPKITGVLAVDGVGIHSAERIKIGINISAGSENRTNEDWEDLIQRFEITQRETPFRLSKNCWFGLGKTWVIPTAANEPTKIRIKLNQSALLSTGFSLQIHFRTYTNVYQFAPRENLSAGCTLEFEVHWQLIPRPDNAKPRLTSENWGPFQVDHQK